MYIHVEDFKCDKEWSSHGFWFPSYHGYTNILGGVGARSILIDLQGEQHWMPSWLEFTCTNNMIEYEGLLQGLEKSIYMKVKNLKVFGDPQIIVDQVRKWYITIHHTW